MSNDDLFNLDSEVNIRRRNLPHWTRAGAIYWITFRLADALPLGKLRQLKAEKEEWALQDSAALNDLQRRERERLRTARVQDWLDAGYGACVFRRACVRDLLVECLLRFDGERLKLHAAVVMRNHVHLILEPLENYKLSALMCGIKGGSARAVNRFIGSTGALWM